MPAIKAQIDQLDYRTLGILGAIKNSMDQPAFEDIVEKEAKKSREVVFWELSNKDDEEKKLSVGNLVDKDSFIIFTTECTEDADQGVFRSKMDMASDEFKDYKDLFIGKQVGDCVDLTVQGRAHVATILGVRNKEQASADK
jgi:hypothetical protein